MSFINFGVGYEILNLPSALTIDNNLLTKYHVVGQYGLDRHVRPFMGRHELILEGGDG